MFDVILVGGSYAGLAAALMLGRARRNVLVLDAGRRRNRTVAAAHGFLGQDGARPGDIAAKGKAEVLAYPTVTWRDADVTGARVVDGGFALAAGGEEHRGRRLILATGVVDELPAIPGLAERWGKTVFQCPYCDGYELDRGKLAVLGTSAHSPHHAALVSEWGSETTYFVQPGLEPDEAQLGVLAARGVGVERAPVVAARDAAEGVALVLGDDRVLPFAGVFLVPTIHLPGPFVADLGLALEPGPAGSIYKTDMMKETNVPGVFACGDAAFPAPSIAYAVADGVRAGSGAHHSLIFRPAAPAG